MKKFWKILGVIFLVAIISSGFISLFWWDEPTLDVPSDEPATDFSSDEFDSGFSSDGFTSDEPSEEPNYDVKIQVDDVYQITVGAEVVALGENGGAVELYGAGDGATLRAIGNGNGAIQASEGGQLIVKDLTIEDKRTNAYTNAYSNYLRFGGKVRFENCTFKDVIYVKDNAEAEFVNCSFNSPKSKYYAVWVGDGSASFEGCTFTGYRGLKIHEFEDENEDVISVTVNNCEFRELSEKVGIAIGVFYVNPLETAVRVTNSRFINNQAWDTVGSLAGIDSFYETDMYVNEYAFFEENNVIEFTPMSDDEYWTPNY